jgi:hypothetical protein
VKMIAKITALMIFLSFMCANITYAMEDEQAGEGSSTVKKDAPGDKVDPSATTSPEDSPAQTPNKGTKKGKCSIL